MQVHGTSPSLPAFHNNGEVIVYGQTAVTLTGTFSNAGTLVVIGTPCSFNGEWLDMSTYKSLIRKTGSGSLVNTGTVRTSCVDNSMSPCNLPPSPSSISVTVSGSYVDNGQVTSLNRHS